MNLIELDRALRQLRLGGVAAVLETRLRQAQAEAMAPIDLIACLVSDELTLRTDRLLQRRRKQAAFRDADRTLDNFDFTFNPKMNRSLGFDLATAAFVSKREDALFLAPAEPAKATWRRPSASAPSSKAIKCCIAKRTSCSMNWPTRSPAARAKIIWNRWPPCRCSSSTTSACANSRTPPPRICWKSSCAATNASARCSLPTVPSRTGANCWAMSPPSAPCSTVCCITATCSSAARAAGARRRRGLNE